MIKRKWNLMSDKKVIENLARIVNDLGAKLRERPEVVRCKDCGKRFSSECPLVRADPYETLDSDDDWFCADGMRKDRDPNG